MYRYTGTVYMHVHVHVVQICTCIYNVFPQVYAARQPLDLETSYSKAKRIILRDVLRTDRNFHYFRSDSLVQHTYTYNVQYFLPISSYEEPWNIFSCILLLCWSWFSLQSQKKFEKGPQNSSNLRHVSSRSGICTRTCSSISPTVLYMIHIHIHVYFPSYSECCHFFSCNVFILPLLACLHV